MKRRLLLFYFTFSTLTVYGYTSPQVPSRIQFANMKLYLSQGARKRIQTKVDSLTRSDKYFQVLLDRVSLFLPIVERILKEENLPLDFKYLVIQESELVANAVSVSNAVGFWQLKQLAAQEVGLTISQHVDERMHIVAATHAAANYLKQNHQEFNNWLYALLAYNEGRGGARKLIQKYRPGTKTMTLRNQAHAYIIHFLAHKVAFESALGKKRHPELFLYEYPQVQGKTLSEIAHELGVDSQQVKSHNKWLKSYRVPHDTTCAAIIPMTYQRYVHQVTFEKENISIKHKIDYARHRERAERFPVVTTSRCRKSKSRMRMINKITGIVAQERDDAMLLAEVGNISLSQFLTLNDLDKNHRIVPGQVYYYRPKKRKADARFHIVIPDETWWSIAQKYGIKKKALLLKNRLRKEVPLEVGRVLWLRTIRPPNVPVAYVHQRKVGG